MREIKFRAWDKKNKQWEYPDYITMDGEPMWFDREDGTIEDYSFTDIVLMQYTGLKDKNEKEIYEGDILQNGKEKFTIENELGNNCGECFDVWGWDMPADENAISLWWEVIGNIYENPNLVKPTGVSSHAEVSKGDVTE